MGEVSQADLQRDPNASAMVLMEGMAHSGAGLMAHTTQLFTYCAPRHTMREVSFDREEGSIELLFRWV